VWGVEQAGENQILSRKQVHLDDFLLIGSEMLIRYRQRNKNEINKSLVLSPCRTFLNNRKCGVHLRPLKSRFFFRGRNLSSDIKCGGGGGGLNQPWHVQIGGAGLFWRTRWRPRLKWRCTSRAARRLEQQQPAPTGPRAAPVTCGAAWEERGNAPTGGGWGGGGYPDFRASLR